nr:MAG TPA: hypothetical protein [Caudoviricetes sp.]
MKESNGTNKKEPYKKVQRNSELRTAILNSII